jgi:hypothetical protein
MGRTRRRGWRGWICRQDGSVRLGCFRPHLVTILACSCLPRLVGWRRSRSEKLSGLPKPISSPSDLCLDRLVYVISLDNSIGKPYKNKVGATTIRYRKLIKARRRYKRSDKVAIVPQALYLQSMQPRFANCRPRRSYQTAFLSGSTHWMHAGSHSLPDRRFRVRRARSLFTDAPDRSHIRTHRG